MGESLHVKMIRLRFILLLVSLSRVGCLETRGQIFEVTADVAVDRSNCTELRSITDTVSRQLCVQKCNEMQQVKCRHI